MAENYQKIIKSPKQIADDFDNIGLNDSDARHQQSIALSEVLQMVSKRKYKDVNEFERLRRFYFSGCEGS